jgi:hypothetical protein
MTLALLLTACAQAQKPDDGHGGGGGSGSSADAGAPAPPPGGVPATRLLYFTEGGDAWLASAAGTEPRKICDAAAPHPDLDGKRALCVPAATDTPLRLYDLGTFSVIEEYADWRQGSTSTPALSPDGSKIAFSALDDAGQDVVRVVDDGQHVLAETPAFGVVAFPGPETLLLDAGDGPPAVWHVGDADKHTLRGTNPAPIGPDPAGVAYETIDDLHVRFLGGDGAERDLGAGQIGGVWGTHVLVAPVEGAAGTAHLLDLADPHADETLDLASVPFDRQRGTRLAGPHTVLVEDQVFATCQGFQERRPTKTHWYDLKAGRDVVLADTGADPHLALPDQRGAHALVLDVDPCGHPKGTGRVVDLSDGSARPLTDFLPDPVRAGAISPDGRFVALSLAGGVRVLDLSGDTTLRVAATGAAGGDVLEFR